MPLQKLSRLRRTASLRNLVRETRLCVDDLIRPIFVTHCNKRLAIESMPGQFHFPLDQIEHTIEASMKLGVNGIILFGIPEIRDEFATYTINENGIIQRAIREIKSVIPEVVVVTDVCIDEYTDHGHCGITERGSVNNDKTLDILAKISVSHVQAGSDIVAPSAMMDGQVAAIRSSLDQNGYIESPIMAYSAKYASGFYGPFREAAMSAP